MTIFSWRNKWFCKEELTQPMDDHLRKTYEKHLEKAMNGDYDHWLQNPHGALAFIVLLDQFSRNIYRNTKKCWEQDSRALEVCLQCINSKMDQGNHTFWIFSPFRTQTSGKVLKGVIASFYSH